MIVIDMDMPKSCCECPICHPKGKDEPWNYACFQGMMDINLDEWDEKRHSNCPIKCDIEQIRAEIEKVFCMSVVTNELRTPMEVKTEVLQIIDKYR